MSDDRTVDLLKALADDTRLEVVRELAKSGDCVSCRKVSSVSSLSQPAMSHHFNKLVEAGVIFEEKNGKEKSYTLNKKLLLTMGLNPELL